VNAARRFIATSGHGSGLPEESEPPATCLNVWSRGKVHAEGCGGIRRKPGEHNLIASALNQHGRCTGLPGASSLIGRFKYQPREHVLGRSIEGWNHFDIDRLETEIGEERSPKHLSDEHSKSKVMAGARGFLGLSRPFSSAPIVRWRCHRADTSALARGQPNDRNGSSFQVPTVAPNVRSYAARRRSSFGNGGLGMETDLSGGRWKLPASRSLC
jgi:hypothetical protein